jgi:calcineurin-like phosphoesterase family protein
VLLLHISDLHFRSGEVDTAMDPNAHLRNELTADAARFCKNLGMQPDVVMVSGDVAFQGAEAEYAFAYQWLEDLCQRCGTDLSRVFVIPGNHDIVRDIAKKPLVRTVQDAIRNSSELMLDAAMREQLSDSESGPLLYRSLGPYNTFAEQFFCSLLPPNRTMCVRDLSFRDGTKLRLIGLNSTFLCGERDKPRKLFVDPSAFQITTNPGIENLVMCHHPYSWLGNGEQVDDHLSSVARLLLFGHVHTNRIRLCRDFIQVAASAAHPDRVERGWEPGYNLIELDITEEAGVRTLKARIHVRVWQQRPGEFIAKHDRGQDVFEHSIRLDPCTQLKPETLATAALDRPKTPLEIVEMEEGSMDDLRQISIRFFRLSVSQRAQIVGALNLLEEEDQKLPSFERSRRALLRAKERNIVDKLNQEVNKFAEPTQTEES